MAKRYSVKNEVSPRVTEYLEQRPKPFGEGYLKKGTLVAELKYYCEQRALAGYPVPLGHSELQYDHATALAVEMGPRECRISGIWDRAAQA